jgi:hypothetical protein
MTAMTHTELDSRLEAAILELKQRISERFPDATYVIERGSDPEGTFLVVTVDIDNTDEVVNLIGDRLVDLQVEERLPLYVTPLRPIERVYAELQAERRLKAERSSAAP